MLMACSGTTSTPEGTAVAVPTAVQEQNPTVARMATPAKETAPDPTGFPRTAPTTTPGGFASINHPAPEFPILLHYPGPETRSLAKVLERRRTRAGNRRGQGCRFSRTRRGAVCRGKWNTPRLSQSRHPQPPTEPQCRRRGHAFSARCRDSRLCGIRRFLFPSPRR